MNKKEYELVNESRKSLPRSSLILDSPASPTTSLLSSPPLQLLFIFIIDKNIYIYVLQFYFIHNFLNSISLPETNFQLINMPCFIRLFL